MEYKSRNCTYFRKILFSSNKEKREVSESGKRERTDEERERNREKRREERKMRASTGSALNLKEKPTKSDKRKSEPPADGLRDAPPPKEGIKSLRRRFNDKKSVQRIRFSRVERWTQTPLHRIEKRLNFLVSFLGEIGRPDVTGNRRFFRKKAGFRES